MTAKLFCCRAALAAYWNFAGKPRASWLTRGKEDYDIAFEAESKQQFPA